MTCHPEIYEALGACGLAAKGKVYVARLDQEWTHACAGTSIQHTGQKKSRDVFKEHIKPVLKAQPHLFPGMGYETFEYAAGMVQSRSFSINQENFITGESIEGRAAPSSRVGK